MITATGISFVPNGVDILPPLDITFNDGEVTALIGPNGAGKSTLLKLVSGDIRTKGKVVYDTINMKTLKIKELARHRAVLPQESHLSFAFSLREVVALGDLEDDAEDLIDTCLADMGLGNIADRDYLTLSGGQKQRCQMARVLLQIYDSIRKGFKPIVFLDEPTAALDMAHQHQILKTGRNLAKQGLCVVLVVHDLNLATQYSDRIVVLSDGKVYADGPSTEVMTPQMAREVYGHDIDIILHNGIPTVIARPLL